MNMLVKNIREPTSLNVVWQATEVMDGIPEKRKYFLVGKLVRQNNRVSLRYLVGTPDFNGALEQGFKGYTAFKSNEAALTEVFFAGFTPPEDVMDIFRRRVPSKKRLDYREFLKSKLLPLDCEISDFALLGYSEGRLPSDGYVFMLDFDGYEPPFDFVTEISGFRYYARREDIMVGDDVSLDQEPDNLKDPNAIAIYLRDQKIGYINRTQTKYFREWAERGWRRNVTVAKINGTIDRPRVLLLVQIF